MRKYSRKNNQCNAHLSLGKRAKKIEGVRLKQDNNKKSIIN